MNQEMKNKKTHIPLETSASGNPVGKRDEEDNVTVICICCGEST